MGVLDGLDEFEGGIAAPQVTIRNAPAKLSQGTATVAVPQINGQEIGTPVVNRFEVRIEQLELAPAADMLYSQFKLRDFAENTDPQLVTYARALEQRGSHIPALVVLPCDREIEINGTSYPMYRLYHNPYVYEALLYLRRARVVVEVPENATPGTIMLDALSEQQHTRKVSVLEKCDTALRLSETYGYDQEIIALHLANDSETGEPPSQAYVSALINVAKLPEPVRQLLAQELITFSHAKRLAPLRNDETACIRLAQWICQDGMRRTVSALEDAINDLYPGPGIKPLVSLVEEDGRVKLQRPQALQLVSDRRPPARFTTYDRVMVARAPAIRREMSRFTIEIVPNEEPDKIGVTASSFEALRQWIIGRKGTTPIKDAEAVLLGFLEAVRAGAAEIGALTETGTLRPVIDEEVAQQA